MRLQSLQQQWLLLCGFPRVFFVLVNSQLAGMLLYYVMTGGDHAFGSTAEAIEANILTGQPQMKLLSPEADDLFDRMLATPASKRPSAESILRYLAYF